MFYIKSIENTVMRNSTFVMDCRELLVGVKQHPDETELAFEWLAEQKERLIMY